MLKGRSHAMKREGRKLVKKQRSSYVLTPYPKALQGTSQLRSGKKAKAKKKQRSSTEVLQITQGAAGRRHPGTSW